MIKLIASDMDGTLIGNDQKISKGNLKAIRAAQEKGIAFVIVTGRTYEDVKPMLDEYGLQCECVLMNGSEYKDAEGRTLMGVYLAKAIVPEILNVMAAMGFAFEMYTDQGYYTTNTRETLFKGMLNRAKTYYPGSKDPAELYQKAMAHPHFVKMHYVTDLTGFLKTDVNIGKIVSFAESIEEISRLREALQRLPGLAISSSFVTNIEINDVKATKGHILANVAEKIGLAKDEIAVLGDSLNDYSMFVEFPHSFAMGNAIPEIKEAAKYITATNVEDGVAKAIYRILEM